VYNFSLLCTKDSVSFAVFMLLVEYCLLIKEMHTFFDEMVVFVM